MNKHPENKDHKQDHNQDHKQLPTTTNNHQQPPITLNNHKQPQTEWFMPFPSRVLRLILAWVAHIYASAICWRGSVSNASNQASKRHILNNSKQVKLRISKWTELYIMFGAWHKGFRFVNDHYIIICNVKERTSTVMFFFGRFAKRRNRIKAEERNIAWPNFPRWSRCLPG